MDCGYADNYSGIFLVSHRADRDSFLLSFFSRHFSLAPLRVTCAHASWSISITSWIFFSRIIIFLCRWSIHFVFLFIEKWTNKLSRVLNLPPFSTWQKESNRNQRWDSKDVGKICDFIYVVKRKSKYRNVGLLARYFGTKGTETRCCVDSYFYIKKKKKEKEEKKERKSRWWARIFRLFSCSPRQTFLFLVAWLQARPLCNEEITLFLAEAWWKFFFVWAFA